MSILRRTQEAAMPPRLLQEQRYRTAQINIYLMVALTAVNLILLATGGDSYFLFSAFLPYEIAAIGFMFCGMMPEEFYEEGFEGFTFLPPTFFYITLGIAFFIVAVYVLLALLSRKGRGGFLLAATVLFGIDTVIMLGGSTSFDSFIDLLIHAFFLYEMVLGVIAWRKLKKMPEEQQAPATAAEMQENSEETENDQI